MTPVKGSGPWFIAMIAGEIHDTTFAPTAEAALRRAKEDAIDGELVQIFECKIVGTHRRQNGFAAVEKAKETE